MRVLLIVAHPNTDSFTHALAARAETALQAAGHTVDLLDLYALGVSAAMSADEHRAYHSESPLIDPLITAHTELVKAAEAMVFVYPTWWSAQPAILKGWLERVMVPGVGFVFNAKGKVRPGLTHVRRIVGISTYGSPRAYVKLVNDNGRRTLLRTLRLNTSLRGRTKWLGLYAIDTATATQRDRFLARVEKTMRSL
ncbi:MAG: NAD(P)H-dependent oxidoreductase [Actinomycetota bacterium]|nr:NAD(P)H-dependent oxidoreductase [Actinomycetota bacterium]